MSFLQIHLSLWGELARNFEIPIETVIYVTDVKISRSENIKGAMTWSSRFEIEPTAFAEEIERYENEILPFLDALGHFDP